MSYTYCGKCNGDVLVGGLSHIFRHDDEAFCSHDCYVTWMRNAKLGFMPLGEKTLREMEVTEERTVKNYVLAGMTSFMAGGQLVIEAKTRTFSMERHQSNMVVPHSHRYCLLSKVIAGTVVNTLWKKTCREDPEADSFYETILSPTDGGMGEYEKTFRARVCYYKPLQRSYGPGESYFMDCEDIHSIAFSKGTVVEIMEYPEESDTSLILEPAIDGKVIPLSRTEDWMFSDD